MQKFPVVVIVDGENAKAYHSLTLKNEQIVVCGFRDSLERIRREKADAVVLDCGFRVWTGLSTMREIKEIHPNLPVVFLTDLGSEDAAINAFRLGASEYFQKPVNLFDLKITVQKILDIRRIPEGKRMPGLDGSRAGLSPSSACVRTVTTDKPQNILQVISFIEDNLRASLELEQLARKAHLSKFHFCRIFKQHIGMNPMKFVTALRIERAKELLGRSDLTVSFVANEVGFKDLSNFIRQFKKITGVTPTTYRDRDSVGALANR